MSSEFEGIEVGYNASGIVANLASEGPDFWLPSLTVTREELLERMVRGCSRLVFY